MTSSSRKIARAVVDANLLVLLLVGLADRRSISRHRRLERYTDRHYDVLKRLLAPLREVIVTPAILAEVSNLMRQVREPLRTRISIAFAGAVERWREICPETGNVIADPAFILLGYTDVGILQACEELEAELLTDDGDLYSAALQRGRRAIKFSSIEI